MQPDFNSRMIALEGDDGSGKQTAWREVIAQLLTHTNYDVGMCAFPSYSTFGQVIKQVNLGNADVYLDSLDSQRKIEVRCAAFALDRALTLAILLNLVEANPNTIIVSDRGPLSNAVTIGFGLSNNVITTDEARTLYTSSMPSLDQELIGAFNPLSILLTTAGGGSAIAGGERAPLDDYESLENRSPIEVVYNQLIDPTRQVSTKVEGYWRDPSEIAQDILRIAGFDISDPHYDPQIISISMDNKRLSPVGPLQFLQTYFGDEAIKLLDRSQKALLEAWPYVLTAQHSVLPNKDAYVDQMERAIAYELFELISKLSLRSGIHPTAISAVRRIMASYPELKDVISYAMPEYGSVINSFIEKVIALEPGEV